ncbi:hypothetical protein BD779DRAFT_1565861, partial [Infundibulicybe gibba]
MVSTFSSNHLRRPSNFLVPISLSFQPPNSRTSSASALPTLEYPSLLPQILPALPHLFP